MTRDSKNILILLFFVLLTTGLNAKPRSVYLDKELKEALLTEYVEIVNYTDTTIIFKTIDSNKVLTAKIRGAVVQGQKFDKHTTGYWPVQGDKVLIVVGQNGYISLFAHKQDNNYRFWSPEFTGSTAMFYFKKPAIKLQDNKGLENNKGEYDTCWDGCLLPIDNLKTYGRE
jgi:hypothetical protein